MGVYNIIFSDEEKAEFLSKLLEELKNGENRTTHLAEKIGVATTTIKRFKQQLIDERQDYRSRNRKGCRRKKQK